MAFASVKTTYQTMKTVDLVAIFVPQDTAVLMAFASQIAFQIAQAKPVVMMVAEGLAALAQTAKNAATAYVKLAAMAVTVVMMNAA